MTITHIADGMYCVEHDGRNQIFYVAGAVADRWIFWNGQVFHGDFRIGETRRPESDSAISIPPGYVVSGSNRTPLSRTPESGAVRQGRPTLLTAPMPARVSKILTQPGSAVKKGDTLVLLEAMKMELPVRAPADAAVTAVHCREGDLVDADAVLLEFGTP